MSKRRSLQVTAEQCSEFLKRPIPKVEDLNRNLRKSYGRNFFKGQTFEGLRQNAKKMRNPDDSVEKDIKVEQDSDFSVHKKRKTRVKKQEQQVKYTEVPVQIPKPKSPTQDLRSPSFSSSSISSSQSGDQVEQNQSNKEENEQKSQQSGEVVKFQGQVGSKEPQSQQEGDEKAEQQQQPSKQMEEKNQKPVVQSQYQQRLERHLREKQRAERQKMQNDEESSQPEQEQQDKQQQQNQQNQVVEEKEQSLKGYKKNEIVVQIVQQQPKRNTTRISKKELKLLLGSDQKISQNKEQVKPHHAARIRKARVIVRKPPKSPQKPSKPKQIKIEDSKQRQKTKELKRSKPIIEPTKVNVKDFIGEEVQKGVIYEAQASKRNHQLGFCSKVIVDSLYIISNPNLPTYLKDWAFQSSVQSGIIRKKRIIEIQDEPQKEQAPIIKPMPKSMARKSAPVGCGAKLPKSRRRSSRRRR